MITDFNVFENNSKPQVGDYVIVEDKTLSGFAGLNNSEAEAHDFILGSVGQIVYIGDYQNDSSHPYLVRFKHVPEHLTGFFPVEAEGESTPSGNKIVCRK